MIISLKIGGAAAPPAPPPRTPMSLTMQQTVATRHSQQSYMILLKTLCFHILTVYTANCWMTDFVSYHFTHKISLYSNITHNEYTIDFKLISTNLTRKSLTKIDLIHVPKIFSPITVIIKNKSTSMAIRSDTSYFLTSLWQNLN